LERQERLFNSRAAKLVALIFSKPKWRRKPSLSYAKNFCSKINVRRLPDGFVQVSKQVKSNGKFRTIVNPSREIRMQQKLVHIITEAQWGQSKFEYSVKGRGREALIKDTTTQIEKGENAWIIDSDVRNCFNSYDKDALRKVIPLPSVVVKHSVTLDDNVPTNQKNNSTSDKAARSGLMQGSQCSSYFSSKLMELVLIKLDGGCVQSYVDNVLISSKSREKALVLANTLVSVFKKHPAGPLHLNYICLWKLGAHRNILGYAIVPNIWNGISSVQAKPSHISIYKGQKEFVKKGLFVAPDHLEKFEKRFALEWATRHPIWPGKKNGADIFEDSLSERPYRLIFETRKKLLNQKISFGSFAEMKQFASEVSEYLLKDPFYPAKKPKNSFPAA